MFLMNVRDFRPSDTEELVLLYGNTIRNVNSADYTPEQVAAWAPEKPDLDYWRERFAQKNTFVVEKDGELLAFAELEKDGHIDCFYCHHQHQRVGVGTLLMTAIENKARQWGLKRLYSEVSITARSFFEHRGFQVVSEQTVTYNGVEFLNFKMDKRLNG